MVWLANTWVWGVTNRMIKDNSRMVVIKVSKNPATKPALVSGKMMRLKHCQAFAPAICPASSSSRLTCIMAETPEREEYGICLATETTTNRVKVPYKAGIGPSGLMNIAM